MAGDLHRYGDGGWSLPPVPDRPRRKTAHVGRGLTALLFVFTLLLGQASLTALADDEPADTAATTATGEASPGAEGPAADPDGATIDGTSDQAAAEDASTGEPASEGTADEASSEDGATASEPAASGAADGDANDAAADDVAAGSSETVSTTTTPGSPSGDGVQPTVELENPDCLDVMAAGDFLFERKQDPPRDATIQLSFDGLSGTLVVTVNETDRTFGYSLTGDFVAAGVIVKGGPNANFYDYRPSGNAADTRLHAPINPSNGRFYGLSHISFCLTEVERVPGIDVEKSCPDAVQAGTEIEYTITVENTGTEALVDVSVDDTLLGDITTDFEPDLSAGLAVGATATAVVTYEPGPDEESVTNTVTAEGTGDVSGDADTDTATCETDVIEGEFSAIDVAKSCPETVEPGGTIEYTITVENIGTDALVGVSVEDSLVGDITDEFEPDLTAGLAVGASATAVVTYQPGPNEDPVTNSVTATATGDVTGDVDTDTAGCETDVVFGEGPIIRVVKDGPAIAHRGDTVTYTFTVTNVGSVELFDVVPSDPRCDAGTIEAGADVDAGLASGEVWTFTCTHLITQTDPDPLPNTVTVRGDTVPGEGGQEVTDQDSHEVDILQPAIRIVKTVSEDTVPTGTVVTYTYVVTNIGDTRLFDISVDDDVIGHVGDVARLDAGASVTLTGTFTVGASPVTNTGTASGSDILGEFVSDTDTAVVTPIAGGGPTVGGGDGPGDTPFTGFDASDWMTLAVVLGGLGALALMATRRNRGTA